MFFWVVHLNVWVFLQGNQIHDFGCPAFEIGTTWVFFLISSTASIIHHNQSRFIKDRYIGETI